MINLYFKAIQGLSMALLTTVADGRIFSKVIILKERDGFS
jgi:hypothetical protein